MRVVIDSNRSAYSTAYKDKCIYHGDHQALEQVAQRKFFCFFFQVTIIRCLLSCIKLCAIWFAFALSSFDQTPSKVPSNLSYLTILLFPLNAFPEQLARTD